MNSNNGDNSTSHTDGSQAEITAIVKTIINARVDEYGNEYHRYIFMSCVG